MKSSSPCWLPTLTCELLIVYGTNMVRNQRLQGLRLTEPLICVPFFHSLIATPGRLLHLIVEMDLDLKSVQYIVFDEADR